MHLYIIRNICFILNIYIFLIIELDILKKHKVTIEFSSQRRKEKELLWILLNLLLQQKISIRIAICKGHRDSSKSVIVLNY